MRVPNLLRRGRVSFNMTPMIDVVFLLIIFFLVSSHLAKQETQLELPLPIADSGEEEAETVAPRLTLNVLADGSLLLAGRRLAPDDLRERLASSARQHGEDVEVRLRIHRQVAYRWIDTVLVACARAGVWNVTFAVYHSSEVP